MLKGSAQKESFSQIKKKKKRDSTWSNGELFATKNFHNSRILVQVSSEAIKRSRVIIDWLHVKIPTSTSQYNRN